MPQTNDNKPYSEEEARNALGGSVANGSSRTQGAAQSSPVLRGLRRILKILYQFTIGSCLYTLLPNCSRPNHDNAADQYELNNHASREAKREEFKKRAAESDKCMKEKINFHFQSHYQKWKRKQFPFKPSLHLLLVMLVTLQVLIFANNNSKFTRFLIGNENAFELYFKQTKCDELQEVEKLYTLQDVYNQVHLIVDSYYNISKQAVGSFRYVVADGNVTTTPPTLSMEIIYYGIGCGRDESQFFPYADPNLIWYTHLFPPNLDDVDPAISTDDRCCNTEMTSSRCSIDFCDCSIEEQINCYINESNLDRVDKITFNFTLATFFRDHIVEDKASIHAALLIHITLVNDLYSSMTVNIDLDATLRRYCNDFNAGITMLDLVILILIILSTITYIGSVVRTHKLAKELKLHFLAYHKRQLRWTETFVLYNKWYIFMLFTNILIFVAVFLKIISEYTEEISVPLVELVRVLLGGGIFCLWCGLFGLLSYFESLNVLFIVIQQAFPSVMRFSICVLILFTAFVLCGWLVLGPYHPKFEDFSLSLESLFCILIGDDLFVTFETAHSSSQSYAIKFFSELYLVFFIVIFIYVVLSLFIGIFEHAYDSLSQNWNQYSHGYLRDWAEENQGNDKTKNYPFPVPPVRNPATSVDNCQKDESSNVDAQRNHATDDNPTVPTHHNNTCTNSSLIKVQVAQPPVATKAEINNARIKLWKSNMLSNWELIDDDDDS